MVAEAFAASCWEYYNRVTAIHGGGVASACRVKKYQNPTSEEVFGELLNHLVLVRQPDEKEAFVWLPSWHGYRASS